MTNCKNCGAVIKGDSCEYCGTVFSCMAAKEEETEITTEITYYANNLPVLTLNEVRKSFGLKPIK